MILIICLPIAFFVILWRKEIYGRSFTLIILIYLSIIYLFTFWRHRANVLSNVSCSQIVVSLLNNRPSANSFFNSSVLQEFTRATNVRLRLLRTKTLLGHLMSVARQDPSVTRRVGFDFLSFLFSRSFSLFTFWEMWRMIYDMRIGKLRYTWVFIIS